MGARGGRRRAACGWRDAACALDAGPRERPPVLRAAPGERALHRRPRARTRLRRMCTVHCSLRITGYAITRAPRALLVSDTAINNLMYLADLFFLHISC